MGSIIRRLKMQTVRVNLKFNRFICSSLEIESNRGNRPTEQRIAFVRKWDAAAQERQNLQEILESLERQERAGQRDHDVWTKV